MSASLSGVSNLQVLASDGTLAASHRLYTYARGTTAFKACYTEPTGTTSHTYTPDGTGLPNGQYIALDARGELPAPLFFTSGAYDLCLKTPAGATVWTRYAVGTDDASGGLDTAIRADLASNSDVAKGDALIGVKLNATGATARTQHTKNAESISVADFGAVGNGIADDTAAIQAAMTAMTSYSVRRMYFPPGTYAISATLVPPTGLTAAEFVGASGYDGIRGPINDSLRTGLKWIGAASASTAMVKFNQANGIVWRGISLNCDYKAGYGIQFMSSVLASGSVKNVVKECSIHYALRDGIIVGEDGVPAASPGQRQFFENAFKDLTFYGCARSGIHINEWNADQQYFENVSVYLDDAASPQNTLNAFWFDYGGQASMLLNCQSGGMTVVGGTAGSGYMVKNLGNASSSVGAFGLCLINCWQEGAGGIYYGTTGNNDSKSFVFTNCRSFTSDTANPSVYIDKGTSDRIPYAFVGCTFLSDITVASSSFLAQDLALVNCIFATGKGVVDYNSKRTVEGVYALGNASGGITIPKFAHVATMTLTGNVTAVYLESTSQTVRPVTLIVTQDGTGSHTITWGSQFAASPAIPAPTATASATTTYTFMGDGTVNYLIGKV
jgi:hypothetical protein